LTGVSAGGGQKIQTSSDEDDLKGNTAGTEAEVKGKKRGFSKGRKRGENWHSEDLQRSDHEWDSTFNPLANQRHWKSTVTVGKGRATVHAIQAESRYFKGNRMSRQVTVFLRRNKRKKKGME